MRNIKSMAGLLSLALALGGCGGNLLGSSNLFSSSSKATTGESAAGVGGEVSENDIECPGVEVRTGAATLMIGKPGQEGEPAALDLRYQGTIVRTARECHVSAGVMTMKVGIEGRIITGPAGGPGTVDVPLRIAVVQEGTSPKTIVSKLARVQVTVASAEDRVNFTHVDPEVTFPMPAVLGNIDAYVVYVGFDPVGAAPEKKKPPVKRKPAGKPKAAAKPKQG